MHALPAKELGSRFGARLHVAAFSADSRRCHQSNAFIRWRIAVRKRVRLRRHPRPAKPCVVPANGASPALCRVPKSSEDVTGAALNNSVVFAD